jgi:uncharacterized peroxidase-related enzyme
MSRLSTPASIDAAPVAARSALQSLQKQFGSVPNGFLVIANSPAALDAYLGLNAGMARGMLDSKTRERIALAVAEINGCSYCLSAHSTLARSISKLDDAEILANRRGTSTDPRVAIVIEFVRRIVLSRGHVTDADVEAVRLAGYDDAQIIEIVLHVALNTLTNYVHTVAQTDIDFPVVRPLAPKAA